MESWWNKESNETAIKLFEVKIREIFLFQNQKKSKLKLSLDYWSNLTANPIAIKIWLQFTRIEEYWLDFFLGRRSMLKGEIW